MLLLAADRDENDVGGFQDRLNIRVGHFLHGVCPDLWFGFGFLCHIKNLLFG
jgi:hypothetical protein